MATKSNFREWTFDKIDDAFGTRQVFQNQILNDWTNAPYACSEYEKRYLLQLQRTLVLGVNDWNEVELENKFISPLIVFTEIDNEHFCYFLARELAVTIGNYDLYGKVDGMIATGFRNPRKPFFCLNEYKRQTDPDGNPQAQALIAMLAAQYLNDSPTPIYGCYVIGIMWHFMVLDGKQYAVSKAFKSDDDEIFDVFRILKTLKARIELQTGFAQ
jgi:hypothetical protein